MEVCRTRSDPVVNAKQIEKEAWAKLEQALDAYRDALQALVANEPNRDPEVARRFREASQARRAAIIEFAERTAAAGAGGEEVR
jgi:hypothetical protein